MYMHLYSDCDWLLEYSMAGKRFESGAVLIFSLCSIVKLFALDTKCAAQHVDSSPS